MPGWLEQIVKVLPAPEALRLDLLARLLLAAVLGGAIGIEREVQGKPAGLRTNLLICVGAALLTEISVTIGRLAAPGVSADPARIAAQIVSGIGFLGAGTIIQARGHVIGLTTAATLWVVAAIGISVGARAYVEAAGTTALVLVALIPLAYLERHLLRLQRARILRVTLADDAAILQRLHEYLAGAGSHARCIEVQRRPEAGVMVAVFESAAPELRLQGTLQGLVELEGVRGVSVE